PRS
ncbi:hypothetical protein CP8484711_1367, partial [Chlamydia psittaci 84-8471/1]